MSETANALANKQRALPGRSKAEKAAAVLAMLDEGTLGVLSGRLPDRHRDKLLDLAQRMRTIPQSELKRIAGEFAKQFQDERKAVRGGSETAARLEGALFTPQFDFSSMSPDDFMDDIAGPAEEEESSVWKQVAELPAQKVADFLATKPATVISIALKELPEDASSEIVGVMPEPIMREAMVKLATNADPNPLAIQAVEQMFLTTLLVEDEEEPEVSPAAEKMASILNRMTSSKREIVLEALREKLSEKELAAILGKVLSFPGLEQRLPRNAIPIIFREIEESLLLTAIGYSADKSQPVADYLLNNISQRLATQLREKMAESDEVTEEEGEKAQSAVICRILEMSEEGKITLLETETTLAIAE